MSTMSTTQTEAPNRQLHAEKQTPSRGAGLEIGIQTELEPILQSKQSETYAEIGIQTEWEPDHQAHQSVDKTPTTNEPEQPGPAPPDNSEENISAPCQELQSELKSTARFHYFSAA